jgi:uncharacterized protein
MILSNYTTTISHYPHKYQHVIYNYLYDSLCIVDESIFNILRKSTDESDLQANLSCDEYHVLKNLKILKEKDEKIKCSDILETLLDNSASVNLIIFLTNQCNLDCFYCFQKNEDSTKFTRLSKGTSDLLIKWIKQFCGKYKIRKLSVLFYGGEPLLNKEILARIAYKLHNITKSMNIKYSFLISTNGTLLDVDYVKRIKHWGLSNVQITIDGTSDMHDMRRPFKGKKHSSYHCIVENIKAVSKVTKNIILRMNIDKENSETIPDLLEELEKNNLAEKVSIYFMPLYQPYRGWNKRQSLLPEKEISRLLLRYYSIAGRMGLTIIPYYTGGICQFYGKYSFSITDNGNIYKCPNIVNSSYCIGNINRGISEKRNDRVRHVSFGKCINCKYVLICAKGCRHQAYVRKKNINANFCQKQLLDDLMIFYIKHEIKERYLKDGHKNE